MDILKGVEEILEREKESERSLQMVCEFLRENVGHYDWVGFYIVAGDELVLGPYSGAPTEHVRIGFGEGICGQAAERKDVFVVQDVSKEENYLSCSPDVKSEVVIPILYGDAVIGELDIDSHRLSPFNHGEIHMLENICDIVSERVRELRHV